jgi:hypothetical protein
MAACDAKPSLAGLRESFAQQVASNRFIKDFQRSGDELTFSGPGADGGVAKWLIRIDSAVVEANSDPAQPYKGVVKSSWYSDNHIVQPRGRDSNLPIELMDNGLSQDCWAFWVQATKQWSWE